MKTIKKVKGKAQTVFLRTTNQSSHYYRYYDITANIPLWNEALDKMTM